MLTSQKSPWGDEWFTMNLVTRPYGEVFWGAVHDVHPPLYFLVVHGFVSLFGQDEWVFRLTSFGASAGTLVMIYLLAKELFNKETALTALFLAAVSPYWLQSSNEIRGYSLLAFSVSCALFFFIRALNTKRRRWLCAYAFSMAAALYIEHYAWFFFFAMTAAVFLAVLKDRSQKLLLWTQGAVLGVGIPSLALIAYQAVYTENVFEPGRMEGYLTLSIMAKKVVGLVWHFSCGYHFSMITVDKASHYLRTSPIFWLSLITTFFAALLVLAGFSRAFKKQRHFFVIGVMALVFPILLLSLFYSIRLDARYLSFAAPLFFIFLAGGVNQIADNRLRFFCMALFGVVSIFGSAEAIRVKTDPIHKEDHKGQIEYAVRNAGQKDAIVGSNFRLDYYRTRSAALSSAPRLYSFEELSRGGAGQFEKIWYLDVTNMHPSEAERIYKKVSGKMAGLGFGPDREPIRIGGAEALTVIYVFRNQQLVHHGMAA